MTGDAIPPLKAGSALGIASAPAVLQPTGRVVVLPIQVAEALQGFESDWTAALDEVGRGRYRWRLVGNAVSVPVAEWIGHRLQAPGVYDASRDLPLPTVAKWPNSAWNMGNGRHVSDASAFPVDAPLGRLSDFDASDWPDLSAKAVGGFIRRARASNLRYPDGFLDVLESHLVRKTSEMSYGRASMRLNPSSGS